MMSGTLTHSADALITTCLNHQGWSPEPDPVRFRALHCLLRQDPAAALPGLEDLVARGSAASLLCLADLYMDRPSAAQSWFLEARDRGLPPALHMLGCSLHRLREHALAFAAFALAANQSDLPSIRRLAHMHRRGQGTPRDLGQCRRLLEQAAARGFVPAKRDLAALLLTGRFGAAAAGRGALIAMGLAAERLAAGPPLADRIPA